MMNLILVSHCNFLGNSAMHVFALAKELTELGHDCWVLVPDSPETVALHGEPNFQVDTYEAALDDSPVFKNGKKPDFIHGWTPRDHVRDAVLALSAKLDAPYVIHMEDHEEQIVADENPGLSFEEISALPDEVIDGVLASLYRSHPTRARDFIQGAVGYTCLIEPLAEFAAKGQKTLVFWPGYDAGFANPPKDRAGTREKYGFEDDETVVLYSGNVHHSIVDDVSKLYGAIALLQRRGRKIRLARTGWDYADLGFDEAAMKRMRVVNLGFLPREDLPKLLYASDILVQPGKANAFNDYRFPSKLPEFLVSGRPVILPDSNIGLHLTNGVEALKLTNSDVFDIAACIETILDSPDGGKALGKAGRAFAQSNLTWAAAAKKLDTFYKALPRKTKRLPAAAIKPTARFSGAQLPIVKPLEPSKFPVDLIAFYLPQYHPVPENDAWWGKGFTEWTNVARAPKNFKLHDQPRLPTDLGFYDLRVPKIMHQQAEMARHYGVSGFCFYYYWFDGRRLLEMALDNWLKHGPDFPFAICWANEPWSRRWDGSNAEMLLEQPYSEGFAERFILDVMPVLKDPRYIRVDGAPLLMIYKAVELPDPAAAVATWRRVAREHGIENLHIVATQSFGIGDPRTYGFDAAVEFSPPHVDRMLVDPTRVHGVKESFTGYLEDYISVAMRSINAEPTDYVRYRGLFPRWDNSARRKSAGHVFINDSTKAYANWLRFLTQEALVRRDQQAPMVFVNAWNEWAEGTYLEPDETYGSSLLEVTRLALSEGVIDYLKGRTPERDKAFNQAVSRVPKLRI
jgi:glycosyltransferase involved in cell wall biosynthesis